MAASASSARCIGVWIDHRKALIVDARNGASSIVTVESPVEPRHRMLGQKGIAPPAHIGGCAETHYQNRRGEQLRRHYDRVLRAIPAGAPLLILGPGQAKLDLVKRMRRRRATDRRLIELKPAGRMTPAQLTTHVRRAAAMQIEARGTRARRRRAG